MKIILKLRELVNAKQLTKLFFFYWELGVLLVYDLSKMDNILFSFDQKTCSSMLETCGRPEKWATRSSSFGNIYTQNLVIDVQDSEPKKNKREKATKEQPVWMSQSTVEGATTVTNNIAGKL